MTLETPTMADMSGEKRDRRSDHTDQPPTTPNIKDTKLLCADDKVAIGRKKEEELVEPDSNTDDKANNDDILALVDPPVLKKSVVTDVDFDSMLDTNGLDGKVADELVIHNPTSLTTTFDKALTDTANDGDTKKPGQAVAIADSKPGGKALFSSEAQEQFDNYQNKKNNDNKDDQETKKETEKEKNNKNKTEKNNNMDTTDTNGVDAYDDKAVLILTTVKGQTSKWKGLHTTLKNIMPYMASDRTGASMDLDNFIRHFNITESIIGRDNWVDLFSKSHGLIGKKTKLLKKFGVRLAATDPHEFFQSYEFDGERLLSGRMQNAWAGAYVFYGPGWQPEVQVCLDISSGIAKPTIWWNKLDSKETASITQFRPSEIFSDNADSMHDLERHLRLKFGLKVADAKEWMAGFKKHSKDPKARHTLIRLAKTPLSVFTKDLFADPKRTKLTTSSLTTFWLSAYRIAGAPWHYPSPKVTANPAAPEALKTSPNKSSLKKSKDPPVTPGTHTPTASPTYAQKAASEPASADATKGVSFIPGTKSTGLFISRSARPLKPVTRPKADARKHENVYYSVEFPDLDSDWKSQEASVEITETFNDMVQHILDKDKKALIHMWDLGSASGSLSKKSDPVKSKHQAKKYASQLWLRTGFTTKFRMRVSHDVLPSLLELHSPKGLVIERDHIQEKDLTIIGFLVGSCPASANLEDMQEAHENHPILHGLKIVAEVKPIKLAPGKNLIPWPLQVKAIHILVGESQSVQARDLYNKVFGSRNLGGYPQALEMRFVPDISDPRFPVTKNTRIKAIKMMAKQKVFQENTKIINTTTIAGIHVIVQQIGFSLCQILMSIKSNRDRTMTVFISIDEQVIDGQYVVVFTAHKDRYDEANALVPLLCIFLETKFGECIWEWFTDEAKRILLKYRWDPAEQMAVLIEPEDDGEAMDVDVDDEYLKSICDTLNVDGEQGCDGFEFDINFLIDENARPNNQYGDTGSVKTFRSACNEIPDDLTDDGSAVSSEFDKANSKAKSRSSSPDSLTIDTAEETQTTSTLTADTKGMEHSLEQMMLNNPDLVQKFLAKNSIRDTQLDDNSKTTAVSPSAGVDGS
jgi:hypothetical protein